MGWIHRACVTTISLGVLCIGLPPTNAMGLCEGTGSSRESRWCLAETTVSLADGGAVSGRIEPADMDTFSPTRSTQTNPVCHDLDGDGYGPHCDLGEDCDDDDPTRHPEALETCDFVDNNCDGEVDESCPMPQVDPLDRVTVPRGDFLMGSPEAEGNRDEHPLHRLTLDGFVIDQYEVTNGRFRDCVLAGACTPPHESGSSLRNSYYDDSRYDTYPVINVSWFQADQYCRWAGGRLPSEAEWESSARGAAPGTRRFPWGDDGPTCERANFGGVAGCVGDTDTVGRRPEGASPHGVDDMAGNVWEWVNDWYDSQYYRSSPAQNPEGPEWGSYRVLRGGCFDEGPDHIRVSCRANRFPTAWAANVGFRCAYGEATGP